MIKGFSDTKVEKLKEIAEKLVNVSAFKSGKVLHGEMYPPVPDARPSSTPSAPRRRRAQTTGRPTSSR